MEELDLLGKVWKVGASEAVILYSSRILEALAPDALRAAHLEPRPNVFANLVTLQQYNLISSVTAYWAHALRRLGNQVRHIRSRVGPRDADLAVLFMERWLEWFFCWFRYGPRLDRLTPDGQPDRLVAAVKARDLMEALEDLDSNLETLLHQVHAGPNSEMLQVPILTAVLAELLLERDELDSARAVLDVALRYFPDDLRLQQLAGLYWSRSGGLPEALRYLQPLYEQYRDDEETAGITAGVYKRLWRLDNNDREWLEKAYRIYRQSWERSLKTNAWLGVNASTTALWLGRPLESRRLAEEVRQLLHRRSAALASQENDAEILFNYWDQVTLAEAELLSGESGTARRLYHQALSRHADRQRGNVAISLQQLDEILPALGLSEGATAFLGRPPVSIPVHPMRVGVVGHRRLPGEERLLGLSEQSLTRLLARAVAEVQPCLVLLSALAEGADQLVAEVALSPAINGLLEAVLPLELADYSTTFESEQSQLRLRALLDRAHAIRFVSPPPSGAPERSGRAATSAHAERSTAQEREAAYEWGGRYIVDRCEVLLALWDGQPACGRGGTAETIAYARQVGRPLVWIQTNAPHQVVEERMDKLRH
jgi:tetratricopeptide (TPR) repeat protein